MDLLYQVNIRKRRSQRIHLKTIDSPKRGCLEQTPLGYFERLPLEILHVVFSYLSVIDLSKFGIVSKTILQVIEQYRKETRDGQRKFLLDFDVHSLERFGNWPSDAIHSYFRLGIYMKRSSFLKSTSRRMNHIREYLIERLMCGNYCGDGRKCVSFYCYGTFLHTVIAGWDDAECLRVLDFTHQNTSVMKYVTKIFTCNPGVYPHLEVYVRCFYRRAFIDVLRKKEDKAFWLNQILKPHPMVHQARLLQMLFLTKTAVGINFMGPVRDRLDASSMSDLGNALQLLSDCVAWTDDSVISVIDEIIASPSPWHPQNVAALLLACGDNITVKVLISKAINNRLTEIVSINHNLMVVCVKSTNSIKKASQSLWKFLEQLKTTEKIYIANELVNSFKDAVYDFVDAGGEPITELDAVLESMTQFTQDLLNLALNSVKEQDVLKSSYTQVSKVNTPSAHNSVPAIEE